MKKTMLFLFGFGDTFCDTKSHRCIKRGLELVNQSLELLANPKYNFYGVVRVNEPSDTFNTIDIGKHVNPNRLIDVKLCANSLFSNNNQISIPGSGGDTILDGNQLDFVISPEDFNISIAGIDINGIFINSIDELIDRGFSVNVFSNIIKPFTKSTIDSIKKSKARFGKS